MIKDSQIPLPRWEISDPFGRAALRSMRYELKKALCERDGYKAERDEILKAKSNAVDGLQQTILHLQNNYAEMREMFYGAKKMQKAIADKNRELREKLADTETARMLLRVELERLKEEHARLQEDHEQLLYLIKNKEAEI